MKKVISKKKRVGVHATTGQTKEMKVLAKMRDSQIDTSDMPEVRDWSDARRGLFYKPIKHQLTLRLDADIVAWFKGRVGKGVGYQTSINRALREYIEERIS